MTRRPSSLERRFPGETVAQHVDGPHPQRFSCKVCGQSHENAYKHQLSNSDRGYCASCYQIAARKTRVEPASSVPVGAGNVQSYGVGEFQSLWESKEPWKFLRLPCSVNGDRCPCAYCSHRCSRSDTEVADEMRILTATTERYSLASARLEAWSRAEKPRVTNTADQREFRKPHPWEEFDELESR